MFASSARLVRASFRIALVAAIGALLALVALPHLLPFTGREAYVVRGGSMSPAIPVGSIVIVERESIDAVAIGDVITFRGADNTIITHRVIDGPRGPAGVMQTKGDASESADTFGVGASALVGEVEIVVPVIGSVLMTLGTTAGAVATITLISGLTFAVWFMDELIGGRPRASGRRTPVAEGV